MSGRLSAGDGFGFKDKKVLIGWGIMKIAGEKTVLRTMVEQDKRMLSDLTERAQEHFWDFLIW